ncbi:MAG: sigma-54-dependent transcriptional regulator, partial [Polyangiales bacterium]
MSGSTRPPSVAPLPKAHVLVCEDEPGLRETLGVMLRRAGYQATLCAGVRAGLAALPRTADRAVDVVITDLMMPDGSGMQVLEHARQVAPDIQVIIITAHATTEQAVAAMRLGAYDYIQKPFKQRELLATLEKALEKRAIVAENRDLKAQLQAVTAHSQTRLGLSPAMRRIDALVDRLADAPSSVLLTGESGVGKEVVARALHQRGSRQARPFVPVNCGAIPDNLLESELFGYDKGAFSGATQAKEGLLRQSSGGTLFLDEIGELPLSMQVKLLRVLQEHKVRPLGSEREHAVDLRIVAATNRDLEAEVQAGRFRQDLFYRLNVVRIHIPPLRERPEDVPFLIERLLHKHCALHGRQLRLSKDATAALLQQPYPGNVRELENLIERAVTLALDEDITLADLMLPGAPIAQTPTPGLAPAAATPTAAAAPP